MTRLSGAAGTAAAKPGHCMLLTHTEFALKWCDVNSGECWLRGNVCLARIPPVIMALMEQSEIALRNTHEGAAQDAHDISEERW